MNNISDWLPDKKYYEYAYHKFYNPDVEYHNWQPWDEWTYPQRDILRFEKIIKDQKVFIKNHRVLDIACHLGYISLFCLYNEASYVTGTNVRERELKIANEIINYAGYQNFQLLNSDLYNLVEFENLCNQHDTIILSGIMYHINNHYQLLNIISKTNIKNIIIESQINGNLADKNKPYIYWINEDTSLPINGFFENKKSTFVGIPNKSWFIEALISLDYKIVYDDQIFITVHNLPLDRIIITAVKK